MLTPAVPARYIAGREVRASMNGITNSAAQPQERRDYQRVTVSIPGRYMLEDKREFPCRTIDFSVNGVSLAAPERGKIGERVVVYLDYIGRIEGSIVRHTLFGFALALMLPGNKREKIADQLTWLVNREALGKADRRHDRLVPNLRHCILQFADGKEHLVKLIDISVSGAGIVTDLKIPIGTNVLLGATHGHVIRHFENGVAVEFDTPIPIERFDEDLRL
jgi:hypothetical protein